MLGWFQVVSGEVFKRIMYLQIDTFMRGKLLTGFRKNHSTQLCLMSMLEMWKNTLDKGGFVSGVFMDFSKAFDTLKHNLLIAKIGAYGFERDSLSFMKSYLNDRQQRVRVNNNFSSWEKIIAGVPQGSILGPLLFNIFINDLFLFVSSSNLSNSADDNTLYASGFNLEEVKSCLRTDFDAVTKWLYENHMALNAGKCHFMCLGKDTRNETFIFRGLVMKNSKEQKILGVTIDNKLTFKSHIKNLCKKASQKIGALSRLSNHLNDSQKRLILNSIVKSQFSYFPLVWMFCSRTSNNMINKAHERALRKLSDTQNLQNQKRFGPAMLGSILKGKNNTYSVRNFQEFDREGKRTVYFGLETLSLRSPQLWSLMPEHMRQLNSIDQFKRRVRQWVGNTCRCRFCKVYLQNVGFL